VVRLSNDGSIRAVRRAEQRRVEILRAAATVFRNRGFAAAGMREIAIAADLSPANLYHYFGGKEEILFFCQDRTLDRLLSAARKAQTERGPLAARLHALAASHVRCIVDEVEGSAAHFEVDALPYYLRQRIVAKRDRYERAVRALVARGIARRELAKTDATIATRAFLGALNWTAQWFRPDGPVGPEPIATVVADYAVAGLLKTRGDVRAAAPTRSDRAARQRRADAGRLRRVQNTARGPS
jgi:TetR/AcrR family transcriptional regulator, cholesterol catabolism regulator